MPVRARLRYLLTPADGQRRTRCARFVPCPCAGKTGKPRAERCPAGHEESSGKRPALRSSFGASSGCSLLAVGKFESVLRANFGHSVCHACDTPRRMRVGIKRGLTERDYDPFSPVSRGEGWDEGSGLGRPLSPTLSPLRGARGRTAWASAGRPPMTPSPRSAGAKVGMRGPAWHGPSPQPSPRFAGRGGGVRGLPLAGRL
jgi:hypothetical protein